MEMNGKDAMQSFPNNYDLAVIGGGPAGAAAAITTARLGAKAVLLEAGEFPRQKVCGEFVSAESLDVLRNLLREVRDADSVLRAAPVIDHAQLFLAGRRLQTPVSPPALSIPRYDLDRLLWHADNNQPASNDCRTRWR